MRSCSGVTVSEVKEVGDGRQAMDVFIDDKYDLGHHGPQDAPRRRPSPAEVRQGGATPRASSS
ncbi:MAG: hypothetical protein MZV70_75370 [Desulfobacterales bacterium]|nr:hypothetical protein [Desulfobacterales bacterium]